MQTIQRLPITREKRAKYYWRKYRLTLERFDEILQEQDHRCPLCNTMLTELSTKCVWQVPDDAGELYVESIVCRRCLTNHDKPHLNTRRNKNAANRVPTVRATAPSVS